MRAWSGVRLLPLVMVALALAGCASSPEMQGSYVHGRFRMGRPNYTVAPYQVNGVRYYPRVDYHYDETGTASWYGPGFDHHPTSDGEIYDMNQLSAAHKTLPLPSVVEVTNLQNGRSVRLRVNDRGPFVGDRLIDVSRRAAQLLGFERTGTAPVHVQILKDQSIKVAEAAMRGEYGPMGGSVGVAAAAPATRMQVASAAPRRPPPPQPAPPLAPAPAQIAAADPGPASLRAQEVIGAPPPMQPAAAPPPVAHAPEPPPPLRSPVAVAAAPRRTYWPSLIAEAHAEPLLKAPYTPPAAIRRSGRIFVQAGAFAVPENARKVRARIGDLGRSEIVAATVNGAALYRVRLGPVASEAAAHRLLREVVGSGYPGARLVAD